MPNRPAVPTDQGLRSRPVAALVLCSLLLLPAAPRLAAQEGAVAHRVESVELRSSASGSTEIEVVSSTELGLVGVRADKKGGLFLQLPQHVLAPAVEDLLPPTGLVSAVKCTVDRTSRGPLTRIAVNTRAPFTHTLATEGRRLSLRLRGLDEEPEEVALRRVAEELRASLAASEEARQELSGRVEVLVAENRELVRSFETLEERRRDLDGTLKATLGEVTEMLRGLSVRAEELTEELRQAEGREEELRREVARLESELEASESSRGVSRETEAKLARLEAERDALRQEVRDREARVEELEGLLAAQRAEVARLEQESLDLEMRMSERLEAATERQDELRSQLEGLAAALAEARELEQPPSVELEASRGDDLPARALAVTESTRGGSVIGRTNRGVRLRGGPGTEFEVLRGLPPATAAEVLSRGRTWLHVRLGNGQEGWIHGGYFDLGAGGARRPPEVAGPAAASTSSPPSPDTGPASPAALFFIVAATETEEPLAASFAAGLRAKGYPSEVYWSDSGYFVVTLDRLPVDQARRERDQAVAAGDVPADAYLIAGSTLRKRSP